MGVYIEKMKRPEGCYCCPFAEGSWGYSPPHRKWCLVNGKDMPIDERHVQQNQPQCPLITIPPHGRLIDAYTLMGKTRRDEALNAVANVVNAPTIIEAEEETE